MSGILRLANTGAGTGRSTLQSNASNDVTFNLPDTGSDSTATILTSELHSITSVNWDGMTINITNADFNVDNGTLFVDESTNRVGIGTTSPGRKLDIQTPLGHTILRLANGGNGNRSGIDFYRESSAGTMKGGAGIWVESDTSTSGGVLAFGTANNSGLTSMTPKMVLDNNGQLGVGTDSPNNQLEIAKNDSSCDLRITNTGDNTANRATNLYFAFSDAIGARIQGIRNVGDSATETDLKFSVGGSSNSEERMRITHDGYVGVGTTAPTSLLQVSSGNNTAYDATATDGQAGAGATLNIDLRANTNSGVAQILFTQRSTDELARIVATGGTAPRLAFCTRNVERYTVDGTGRIVIGQPTAITAGGRTAFLQLHGTGADTAGQTIVRYANNAVGPAVFLGKSRSGLGTATGAVVSGDGLGYLIFGGADGSTLNSQAAYVGGFADATPSSGRIPGRLAFFTTPTGSGSGIPTEKFRIDSSGRFNTEAALNADSYFTMRGTSPTTGVNGYLFRQFVDIPATVTDNVFAYHSSANVVSGATLGTYWHYTAVAGTVTGSTINTQVGYYAGGNLINASNNYGFRSDIPSGAGRWGFYSSGDAGNFFAGNTLVGGTNNNPVVNNIFGIALRTNGHILSNTTSSGSVSGFRRNGDGDLITFHNDNATECGSISVTGQATSYNTASDYRLKENIVPISNSVERVLKLKPCRFNFKDNVDRIVDGFLAHEAQEVVPEAVSGDKDGEKYQSMDAAKLIPVLTAALQEALGEIAELKERVKNLEG